MYQKERKGKEPDENFDLWIWKPHPKKEIQRVLDWAKWESFLPAWQVDGQVVELLSFGHHFTTAAKQQVKHTIYILQSDGQFRQRYTLSTLWSSGRRQASRFAGDGVLHFKFHVSCHWAGVDARGVSLFTGLTACWCQSLLAVLAHHRGQRRGCSFACPALVHLFHVVLQLVQTLAQELVSIL